MVAHDAGTSSGSGPGRAARAPVVVAAALALAVCAVVGFALAGRALAGDGGPGVHADPAGDAGPAADVTAVAVSGDPVLRLLDVAVTVTGYMPFDADGLVRVVSVWLDTDSDVATGGSAGGAEFVLNAWRDAEGDWWNVERWDGTGWRYVPESATQCFLRMGDALVWTVHPNDLGGATSFRFSVTSDAYGLTGARVGGDRAPDDPGEKWPYDLAAESRAPDTLPPAASSVKLRVLAPTATPQQAVAGKRFSVSFPVYLERSSLVWVADALDPSGGHTETIMLLEPVYAGTMACAPTVGGRVLVHTESLRAGAARLVFAVPKTAKAKLLTVTVKISTREITGETLTARRAVSFRVR